MFTDLLRGSGSDRGQAVSPSLTVAFRPHVQADSIERDPEAMN